jgi:hypothetical protein
MGTRSAVVLTGLRPSPTSHVVAGFCFERKLAQGPAVRIADRHHSLRLDVVTVTRSACAQVRCAVVCAVERAQATLRRPTRPENTKLDSIFTASPDLAF